jgi:hypothetical protein
VGVASNPGVDPPERTKTNRVKRSSEKLSKMASHVVRHSRFSAKASSLSLSQLEIAWSFQMPT